MNSITISNNYDFNIEFAKICFVGQWSFMYILCVLNINTYMIF